MDRVASIEDLRRLARRRLPAFVMDYVEQGAGDGGGVTRNVEAFGGHRLTPRALRAAAAPDTRIGALGRSWAQPFGISAVGTAGVYRRHADEMLADTAAWADIPFILSGVASADIETIAARAPGHTWFQLYGARDPAVTDDLVRRAAAAGAGALVFTVDYATAPRSQVSIRTGVSLALGPAPGAIPRLLWDALTHPDWTLEFLRYGGAPPLAGWRPYMTCARDFGAGWLGPQAWADLDRIRRLWSGPLVVKGIVHPADAVAAFDAGADAVTVSNHGGNKLDCMPSSLASLIAVRQAVGPDRAVFFDGGIRKGSDIVVARALGADFCFVGRATLYGVAAAGAAGARRAVQLLREELAYTLTMCGCASLAEVTHGLLAPEPWPSGRAPYPSRMDSSTSSPNGVER